MKSTIAPLAVFGLLLASVCNAKIDIKPNDRERILKSNLPSQPIDRSYIKTSDGRKEPRQVEPVKVVTTITPEGRTLQQATGTISCRLWQTCITYFDEVDGQRRDTEQWDCTFDDPGLDNGEYAGNHQKQLVAAGDGDLDEFFRLNGGESGRSVVVVSSATFTHGTMEVALGDVIAIEDYDERNIDTIPGDRGIVGEGGSRDAPPTQAPKPLRGVPESPRRKLASGTKTTLVVRINAIDNSAPAAAQLSEDIFDDEYCLKSQYDRCSYGKLTIQEYIPGVTPTKTPTNLATAENAPGVVDVDINLNAEGSDRSDIQQAANQKLSEMLGTNPGNVFDLVMFCMPPGTGSWIAYAIINRWDSYYNNDWCQAVSSQMHEVGHNIGLHHSGEYEGSDSVQEYGDQTDMMGYSYRSDDTPAMCFNPAKNYQLGWFTDKQITVDPSQDLSTEFKSYILNGFVDYEDDTDDRYVVIRIGNFYIGYNRAAKFNSGVQEAPNQVTVIEKLGEPSAPAKSKLAAKLSIGEQYTFELSELLSVTVAYDSNDNGIDAVVGLAVVGDAVSCQGEYDAEVTIELTTDNYPSETSWGIQDPLGITLFFKDDYSSVGTFTQTVGGLCRGLEYTFFINDQYGDGICCSWGQGGYVVKYKGEVILQGGQFGNQETLKFTLPLDETASPTSSPTDSPTSGPTTGPTGSPTSGPTTGPTDSPTSGATSSPTDSPTSSPSTSPTDSPTSSPTTSPTEGVSEWLYRGKEGKNCEWVAKGSDRQTRIKCLRRAAADPLIEGDVWLFCTEICCDAGINQACRIL